MSNLYRAVMSLHLPIETLYDQRLVERHISRGLLTREQLQTYIDNTPDVTAQVVLIRVEMPNHVAVVKEGSS